MHTIPRVCHYPRSGGQHASMDSDVEAFSRNPTDGSFAVLAFQLATFTKHLSPKPHINQQHIPSIPKHHVSPKPHIHAQHTPNSSKHHVSPKPHINAQHIRSISNTWITRSLTPAITQHEKPQHFNECN